MCSRRACCVSGLSFGTVFPCCSKASFLFGFGARRGSPPRALHKTKRMVVLFAKKTAEQGNDGPRARAHHERVNASCDLALRAALPRRRRALENREWPGARKKKAPRPAASVPELNIGPAVEGSEARPAYQRACSGRVPRQAGLAARPGWRRPLHGGDWRLARFGARCSRAEALRAT
jgi:hypothetical protein